MEHIREQIHKGMKNKIINDICVELKNAFGNYYYFILSLAIEDFEQILNIYKENRIKINEEFLAKQFFADLYAELANCTIPVLVVEIHEFKFEEENQESDLYHLFSEELLKEEFILGLYHKYPELYQLSKKIIQNRIQYMREITQNFIEDYSEIGEIFVGDKELGELSYIKITDGDSHNNGKKVALLVFPDRKLVYKPHHLKPDVLFYDILKKMNGSAGVKISNYIPKFISKETHGWQEFMVNFSCEEEEAIARYYYRLGVLLCNCYLLNCGDIHYENIIANGEYPIIIDLETLVHVRQRKAVPNGSVIKIIEEYNCSVLGTMILPTNFVFSTFDFDISGIGGGVKSNTSDRWNTFTLQNLGTKDIQFKKESFIKNDADNCVKLNEQVVTALQYSEEIEKGFQDAYEYVLDNKEVIIQCFQDADLSIRQVLRPTAVYARFLGTSYYHEYYTSEARRMKLFQKLEANMEEMDRNKVQSEIDSFVRNDIPYFLCKWKSCDLYDGCNHVIEKDYFENSPFDIVMQKMSSISKEDMEKQIYYMKLSLSTIASGEEDVKSVMKVRNIETERPYLSIAQEIADEIVNKAVWSNDECCSMLSLDLLHDRKVVSYAGTELYADGGIILFLASLGKTVKNDTYIRVAKGLLSGLEDMKAQELVKGASLFTGKTSLAYLYYELYRLFEDDSYLEKCRSTLEEIDVQECNGFDIISGVSSGIIVWLNLYENLKEEWLYQKTVLLGRRLLEELEASSDKLFTGLAHGASGPAWALIKLGSVSGEEVFTEKGLELLQYEEQYYEEGVNNWKDIREDILTENIAYWCYGAGGIGISRLKMSSCLQNDCIQSGLLHAASRLEKLDVIENHGLCHGAMGVIDIMNLMVKNKVMDKDILQEKIRVVLEHIEKEGLLSGNKGSLSDYTFMNGLAGIGYAFLRLHNPDIPCVLALEV